MEDILITECEGRLVESTIPSTGISLPFLPFERVRMLLRVKFGQCYGPQTVEQFFTRKILS